MYCFGFISLDWCIKENHVRLRICQTFLQGLGCALITFLHASETGGSETVIGLHWSLITVLLKSLLKETVYIL